MPLPLFAANYVRCPLPPKYAIRHHTQEHGLAAEQAVFLDIGANMGWFGLNAAAAGYNVFAFEPINVRLSAAGLNGQLPALGARAAV